MTRTDLATAIVATLDTLETDAEPAVQCHRPEDMEARLLAGVAVSVAFSWKGYTDLLAPATFYLGTGRELHFTADAPRARSAYEAKLLGAWLTAIGRAVECLENGQ